MKQTIAAIFALGLSALPALAEYPEKPIKLIVSYSAGGGSDVLARTVAQFLKAELGDGASVVVKNVPGAGGQIGFTEIATAAPDGYTIGIFNLPAALALTNDRDASYDVNSFTYLANFVDDPNTLVVSTSSNFESLEALLASAMEAPGAITVGLSSLGGNDHFSANMISASSGAEFTLVPFKGAALARTALMGGHVAVGTMTLSQTIGFQDEMRVLAVLSGERSAFRSEVPTAKELGLNVTMSSLRGVVAPAGLDPEIAATLRDALSAVNANAEFQTMMADQGNPIAFSAGNAYAEVAKAQDEVARKIWEETPWN
ncbi:Tripartite-type tricarboxylate transporter, receptor component TctC [Celeribacter baekdonensis]|uniref:Tripartite-type tricarboxylate transporter, receptor component TctC n=1 Tax=Celeribacter baekdonensis TaxID=875171 RepID=A0A1G7UKM2_9RHOB|nr:tripartite tricarboxylate transporter substrate binding protein [Celeribacter baekdonensis]SDG48043.1 Tripartite-type tricarboxylate transporter, receptor component TctC [Celeribacter baekdonensis]